ncbi:hypothetical protein GMJLKIPL_6297 [Methylobacterium isbiliense]|uniref:Uncharacterized protein n=1 Tax=Methylobacterium isbiliense TaxID=315478 RepID=A0ABQ4SPW8_9HYPH|nr:hypothetical protein GMJLKIPL_6297 [Methylobacterium isbiliense]
MSVASVLLVLLGAAIAILGIAFAAGDFVANWIRAFG